jgi:hypothetical protein
VSEASGPLPKKFKLAERDKHMSEQKQEKPKSFMEELDLWTDANVMEALYNSDPRDWDKLAEQIKKAIREKVLESYRNGQAAGPTKPRGAFKPRPQR